MTWTKTPDDYPELLYDLSSDAYRLHHAATTYANRLLLDGRIPKARINAIQVPPRVRRRSVLSELRDAGFWRDDGDAWYPTDFLRFQPTKEEVEAEREYAAVRQRIRYARSPASKAALRPAEEAARDARNAAREHRRALLSQRESQRVSHGDSRRPVPSRPVPSRTNEDEDGAASLAAGSSPAGSRGAGGVGGDSEPRQQGPGTGSLADGIRAHQPDFMLPPSRMEVLRERLRLDAADRARVRPLGTMPGPGD